MISHAEYLTRCQARWHSWALADARRNWNHWEAIRSELLDVIVRPYLRDNWAKDLHGKCHNSAGTLTGYCWMMSDAFSAEKGQLGSLLDFNEDSQSVFLRRGLIIYLALCIEEIERANQTVNESDLFTAAASAETHGSIANLSSPAPPA